MRAEGTAEALGRTLWSTQEAIDLDQQEARRIDLALLNPFALPLLLSNVSNAATGHHLLTLCRHLAVVDPQGNVSAEAFESWLRRNPIEVYAVAFAWEEHAKTFAAAHPTLAGPEGALFFAHAAYACLMTGLECQEPAWQDLLAKRDLDDPLMRVSDILYELCNFRDAAANVRALEAILASTPPELVPILKAAGLKPRQLQASVPVQAPPKPAPPTERAPLFAWLHISDVHFGHPNSDHALVLDGLRKDIKKQLTEKIPAPQAVLLTGNIAFSGTAGQYEKAEAWLKDLTELLQLDPGRVFLVPGNRDVDCSIDKADRDSDRLVRELRDGREKLDDALADPDDCMRLTGRMDAYLRFAKAFPSTQKPDSIAQIAWAHAFTAPSGLRVHLVGLNTALLSTNNLDKGKLRLGKKALADTLRGLPEDELVLVLTHHPLWGGWLADESDANGYITQSAKVHLFGHVQEAEIKEIRDGSGLGLLRITAAALYGDEQPAHVPARHGYSFAAVMPSEDKSLRLRVWPRRWSERKKDFNVDTDNTPDKRDYAEHPLNLRFDPAPAGPGR